MLFFQWQFPGCGILLSSGWSLSMAFWIKDQLKHVVLFYLLIAIYQMPSIRSKSQSLKTVFQFQILAKLLSDFWILARLFSNSRFSQDCFWSLNPCKIVLDPDSHKISFLFSSVGLVYIFFPMSLSRWSQHMSRYCTDCQTLWEFNLKYIQSQEAQRIWGKKSDGKKSHYSHQLGFVTLQDKQNECNAGTNSEDAPQKNKNSLRILQRGPSLSSSLAISDEAMQALAYIIHSQLQRYSDLLYSLKIFWSCSRLVPCSSRLEFEIHRVLLVWTVARSGLKPLLQDPKLPMCMFKSEDVARSKFKSERFLLQDQVQNPKMLLVQDPKNYPLLHVLLSLCSVNGKKVFSSHPIAFFVTNAKWVVEIWGGDEWGGGGGVEIDLQKLLAGWWWWKGMWRGRSTEKEEEETAQQNFVC